VHDFAASVALAYRLSTRKTTILEQKYEIPGLDRYHLKGHLFKLGFVVYGESLYMMMYVIW
jgi:hypothetical protein